METDPPPDPQDLLRRPSLFGKPAMGCLIALAVPVLCLYLLVKIPMWVSTDPGWDSGLTHSPVRMREQ